jgi:hypothetical protein
MHDTDRVTRQSGPLPFVDLTPTTAPSWNLPVPRLARGTLLPPVARPDLEVAATTRFERVELLAPVARSRRATPKLSLDEALALGVRERAPARRWGRVLAVGFDGELLARPAPVRPLPSPRIPLALLAAAVPILAIALWSSSHAGATHRPDVRRAEPARRSQVVAPAPSVVTITPIEEPAEDEVEIEMPALARPAERKRTPAPVAMTGGEGVVMIGAKPPCRIFVDGKDTGLVTPTRDLVLPAGEHEITLVNDEHGIEDRSTITVRAGAPARLVRDLTAKLVAR